MKILITGGAGFIGYHLTKKLAGEGNQVVIIDDLSRGVKDSFFDELQQKYDVELRSGNFLKKETVEKIEDDFDYIYHLAAIIGVQNVLEHSYDVLSNNVILTINAIDIAKKQKHLKRILFASTSEIYAGTLNYYGLEFPTTEDTPLTVSDLKHPRTSYMLSKIYGEALLRQSNLPYTIFRPHNFYGPRMGMSHVIPELLRKAYKDENNGILQVFSADHKRTFCYIDDAVELITRLAYCDKAEGQEFNIGNEKPEVTMREVGEIVIEVTGAKIDIEALPPSPGSPERRCPSMKKTVSYVKYEPQISLKEGIEKTFDWYKKNIFDGDEICEK
ncbi:MAG: NAD-dependent epimerase/dehydratase family protein [Lachnospiraceae bacterium]|nr:NAD-dependent epimerase/dehydratase family protein [Lachnospiraceae bacterium]